MTNHSLSATDHEVNAIIRANWIDLAYLAYKYYLEEGRGCFVFINGIKETDAFNQITSTYQKLDEFIPFFSKMGKLSDEIIQIARTYNPDTTLLAYVLQAGYPIFVHLGEEFGLLGPKAIWEQYKDTPEFNH